MESMDHRLNGKTEIWADGYSFMEMSETLLVALGIRAEEPNPPESASRRADVTAEEACPGVGLER